MSTFNMQIKTMTNEQIAKKHGLKTKNGSFVFNCTSKYYVAFINSDNTTFGGESATSLKKAKSTKKNWKSGKIMIFKRHLNEKSEYFLKTGAWILD